MSKRLPTRVSITAGRSAVTGPAAQGYGPSSGRREVGQRHQGRVGDVEVVERVEALRMGGGDGGANRAAVADHEGGQRPGGDVGERREHALLVLGERLAAAREAERGAGPQPGGPGLGLLALDLLDQAALPAAAVRLGEAIVHARL